MMRPAGETDPELALEHRGGTELRLDDKLHRLSEQLVAVLIGCRWCCRDVEARRRAGDPSGTRNGGAGRDRGRSGVVGGGFGTD